MTHLIRLASGEFYLEDCYSLEDIEQGHYQFMSLEEHFNILNIITLMMKILFIMVKK